MSKLLNFGLSTKIATLIFLTFNLSGCYDSLYMDEPTHSVNRHYGFYQFYDSPYTYARSPYYDYDCDYDIDYPRISRYRHHTQVHHVYNHHSHHNYNHYNANNANYGYNAGFQAGQRRQRDQARQDQINSDRALAQRLQNEEVANAHRAAQIASDRALAERLQAQEYANIQ